jgi:hypothetical protein
MNKDKLGMKLLNGVHTLVYCALWHKLSGPGVIVETVRNQLFEYPNRWERGRPVRIR